MNHDITISSADDGSVIVECSCGVMLFDSAGRRFPLDDLVKIGELHRSLGLRPDVHQVEDDYGNIIRLFVPA